MSTLAVFPIIQSTLTKVDCLGKTRSFFDLLTTTIAFIVYIFSQAQILTMATNEIVFSERSHKQYVSLLKDNFASINTQKSCCAKISLYQKEIQKKKKKEKKRKRKEKKISFFFFKFLSQKQ